MGPVCCNDVCLILVVVVVDTNGVDVSVASDALLGGTGVVVVVVVVIVVVIVGATAFGASKSLAANRFFLRLTVAGTNAMLVPAAPMD